MSVTFEKEHAHGDGSVRIPCTRGLSGLSVMLKGTDGMWMLSSKGVKKVDKKEDGAIKYQQSTRYHSHAADCCA